jgi:hypothetical protein
MSTYIGTLIRPEPYRPMKLNFPLKNLATSFFYLKTANLTDLNRSLYIFQGGAGIGIDARHAPVLIFHHISATNFFH